MFKGLSPAESLSFHPIPIALQQLTQAPVLTPITRSETNRISYAQEGYKAHSLLARLKDLLGKTDEQLKKGRSNPEPSGTGLCKLLAQLTKLLATDRLLDSIECSETCMGQIMNPACLQCLLNAHSALSISLSSSDHSSSLEKQRRSVASSILGYFSSEVHKAFDKILATSLRACHETRSQSHTITTGTSEQLVSLLSNLCVENADPISVYWGDQLFYTALCRETVVVCESLSSLALSLSKQIREFMQLGDSRPLTALLQIGRSFISAYEKAFSISFSTNLIVEYGEMYLLCFLLSDIKEMEPYFSTRLKLIQARKQSSLVGRLLRRPNPSYIKVYIERIRQNFSSTTTWAPPYPAVGQSLMFNDSAAKRWHIIGVSQLIVDFLILFLGSIFDAFTPIDQVSTFPLVILHTSNNILTGENSIFTRIFTVYAKLISNEVEYNKIDEYS